MNTSPSGADNTGMTITHYDLFAGIGGFSLALEETFKDETIRHIFCEWEQFPTSVLRRHWPDGEFYGDIKDLVADTEQPGLQERKSKNGTQLLGTERNDSPDTDPKRKGLEGREAQASGRSERQSHDGRELRAGHQPSHIAIADSQHQGLEGSSQERPGHTGQLSGERTNETPKGFTIVTGGFPCQPFSHAGRRRGTADDRYQWPNMFAVIRNTKPEWVIAENVRGLVTWNDGMVLETVCADLESEGYEVQPFIIPAVAVGAPHRRDRVWIIGRNSANAHSQRISDGLGQVQSPDGEVPQRHDHAEPGDTSGRADTKSSSADTESQRNRGSASQERREQRQELEPNQRQRRALRSQSEGRSRDIEYPDWNRNWQEVAFATCDDAVDDGLSRLVDGVPMSRSKWRQNSLKAYGNGIVPEVAMNILQAIKESL